MCKEKIEKDAVTKVIFIFGDFCQIFTLERVKVRAPKREHRKCKNESAEIRQESLSAIIKPNLIDLT